ncbi:4-hydroxy-tetrahydrodipicolinate reductase [compost metagenome]
MLAETINNKLNSECSYIYNRHDNKCARSKNEIGISSIRGGNIVGEHVVKFFSENETFEIKHTSYSRTVFAEGAIRAAKFLVSQKSGLYTMQDLI